ncbi:hypothetical protein CMT90_11840 [Elizabethkingia anophelis]|nr:hypothetical protein [Elizabethkingia anophelis]MDV3887623.1 hypothetical protein [Elizabethkingia anophelis]
MTIEVPKHFALIEEFETANKLILMGFGELQNLNISNNFYFLPFQLLSQGFERLMKAYICVSHLEQTEKLPDFKYLKNIGHDLDKLLTEILSKYYFEFTNKLQYDIDYGFLSSDKEFSHLLYIISEFGKHGRYYNFDLITNNTKPSVNTVKLWKEFENELIKRLGIPYEKVLSFDITINNEVYYEISRYVIIKFERFISAISRQIIFNNAGPLAKQISTSNFFDFGLLYENDFGNRDYRMTTSKYKEVSRKAHKRTLFDNLKSRLNKKYRQKKIKRDDFKGDWPFYSDEVIVESRYNNWYVVIISNRDYSLNGAAKGRYKLETPHEAGMAIIGKSLIDFINIAKEL